MVGQVDACTIIVVVVALSSTLHPATCSSILFQFLLPYSITMAKENFTGTSGVIADILTVIGISLLFLASLYGIILFSHYWKRYLVMIMFFYMVFYKIL